MDKILSELNLTDSEIKIYKFLLNYGKSSVGDISKKTEIHRRNVYDCLDRLIKKGFASYIEENNIKVYSITNPKTIMQKLEDKKNYFENVLPELLNKFNSNHNKSETQFFSGKEGLKQIFEDQINIEKEILISASNVKITEILKYYFEQFDMKRKEKNINVKIIFDLNILENKEIKKELAKIPLAKIKYIKNFNSTQMSEYVYGDNVAIVVWSENPIGILIREREIAKAYREKFELIWNISK